MPSLAVLGVFVCAQLSVDLGVDFRLVRLVVVNRLGHKLGRELGKAPQHAFAVVRLSLVEGERTHRQARAGDNGGAAADSRVVRDVRVPRGLNPRRHRRVPAQLDV